MLSMTTCASDPGRGVVAFRTDASLEIGTGHVMRCLTLADELQRNGIRPIFFCRSLAGDLRSEIARRGYELMTLQPLDQIAGTLGSGTYENWLGASYDQDAQETIRAITAGEIFPDWLVVDHYGIDHRWEQLLRPFVGKTLVIDDLANRSHDCEMLLDQNLYDGMSDRYRQLVPPSAVLLLGPQYALLRDEFRRARASLRTRSGAIERLLVFFGGVDQVGMTSRTLAALNKLNRYRFSVVVVLGMGSPHCVEVEQIAKQMKNVTLYVQTNEMARLIAEADLSIGAGGTTTWERAYLGLPSLAAVVAENQRLMTDAAARAGVCHNLGWYEDVSEEVIAQAVTEACASPQLMRKMSRQAMTLSAPDHQTGTGEVAARLLEAIRVHV
jgi:UDP-2,4-diacetamido-2,4,6-trideoxy-beta-L-altropyranose hydrolase